MFLSVYRISTDGSIGACVPGWHFWHYYHNARSNFSQYDSIETWWRHQMETLSALLAFCAGNSPVTGEFPTQRPVTRSFDVFFDLRLSKRLSKQSWGLWFDRPSRSLWRHCNEIPSISSTAASPSNEIQSLTNMIGYQDDHSRNGHQASCPIVL